MFEMPHRLLLASYLLFCAGVPGFAAPGIRVAVDKASATSALSALLLDKIEAALRNSPRFAVTTERSGGTLLISLQSVTKETIERMGPKRVHARVQVRYEAKFVVLPGRTLGTNVGICWKDQLADCAYQVLNSAQVNWSVNQP